MLNDVQLDPSSFLARQLYSVAVSTIGRIVIGGIVTTIARFLGNEPNPKDRISTSERLDQTVFEIIKSCKVEVGHLCWIYLGTSFCRFLMSIELLYFTGPTFFGYLVMMRLFNLYLIIEPLILVKQDLVLPLNHPILIVPTSETPVDPFKRSKFPFKHLLLLRALLFGTLSKIATMSFVGCLLPRLNNSKTIGHI